MFRIVLSLALISLAMPLAAQDTSYSVKRGETIRIFSWSFFGDTCRATDFPKVRAITAPKLGTLTSGRGQIKIRKVVETRLAHCIGKSVEGTVVNYTAGNQPGRDSVRLARKRLGGTDARYDIAITVK